ncbi:MAG: response regulator transcription factor [Chloroflexota bacterium]
MGLPIRLLIVDDHPMMRFGLVSLFQHEPDFLVVAEACNGVEAIEKAIAENPDVILLDLGLPKKSGLEVIQEVLQINPNLKIIVFTSYSDGDRILTAIKAGAIGYLVKDNSPQDIFYAVRNAYQGKPTLSTRTELSLFHEIQDKKPVPSSRDQLTTREIDILRFVALGMKYAEIAKEICVTEGTVRSHMSNLSKKLGFENRAQAVVYAIRNGLIDIEVEKL